MKVFASVFHEIGYLFENATFTCSQSAVREAEALLYHRNSTQRHIIQLLYDTEIMNQVFYIWNIDWKHAVNLSWMEYEAPSRSRWGEVNPNRGPFAPCYQLMIFRVFPIYMAAPSVRMHQMYMVIFMYCKVLFSRSENSNENNE